MNDVNVPAGYKSTDIGVIPEDWKVVTFDKIADIIDPQPDHRTPPEINGGEPYIGISDFINDSFVDWDGCRKIISKALDKQQKSFQICNGDIIFGKIGTIGFPKFLPITSFRYALSANVILIKPKIAPHFLMSWLKSSWVQKQIDQELHSTSQAAFGILKMRDLLIALPPLPEQKAIARVLSDVDELIRECDSLLAKKRDIKQGTMQQLLTGKQRLPGFSGEWKNVSLDSVAEIIDPHPSHRAPKINSNGIPFVGIGDISIDGKIDYSTVRMVDEAIYDEHNQRYQINEGLLGIGRVASIGKVVKLKDDIGKYTVSPTIAIIRSKSISKNLLFYLLSSKDVEKQFSNISNGSTRQSVGITVLRKIILPFPTLPEQKAIARILSDMDAEIEALEQKRDKYKAIKQGMMQELLTGKTRLINN